MVFLFLVTISSLQEWISYAPAAFLGCGSRFSGSLSGVEPLFSVTRNNHGRLIDYHQVDRADTFSEYRRTSRRYAALFRVSKLHPKMIDLL